MHSSIRTLLNEAIDYAGLFPPARLPMASAVQEFAGVRGDPYAWMVGRFVCPCRELASLVEFGRPLFSGRAALPLSIVCESDLSADAMDDLLDEVRAFLQQHGDWAFADAFEIRVPQAIIGDDVAAVSERLNVMADRFGRHALSGAAVFIEPPLDLDRTTAVVRLAPALARHNDRHGRPAPNRTGLKLRCGGPEPAAYPTVDEVCAALLACDEHEIPMKFTAGLHHPVRHFNRAANVSMHGFLNILVAGILRVHRGLGADALHGVLSEQDGGAFLFDGDGLRWRGYDATPGEIAVARREFVTSFGSCSFAEPRDDLRAMTLLK